MVCFTLAFFQPFFYQKCPSRIYFWQSKRRKSPSMFLGTLWAVSIHSQMTPKVGDTWNRSEHAGRTNTECFSRVKDPCLRPKAFWENTVRVILLLLCPMDAREQRKGFISMVCRWWNTRKFRGPLFSRCSWWRRWTSFLPSRWRVVLFFFFFFCYLRLSTWHLSAGRRYLKVTADGGAKQPGKSIRLFPFPATNTHACHKSCST